MTGRDSDWFRFEAEGRYNHFNVANRRIAVFADRNRESRKWAGKRALPRDTYLPGLRPELPRLVP
jgi:hypothetical protein